jgi:hypothetical protein
MRVVFGLQIKVFLFQSDVHISFQIYVNIIYNLVFVVFDKIRHSWADELSPACRGFPSYKVVLQSEINTVIPRLTSDPANEFFG